MESDIARWLSFAAKVEDKLYTLNNDAFSDTYKTGLTNLLHDLRNEAAKVESSIVAEKQAGYFNANILAQKLRNAAYFVRSV